MGNMLHKELKLATSPLTFIFLIFTLMVFIPGYPILMSAFFICLGIFHSFNQARVTNDILFSALLPIKKSDVVRSKYLCVCFIEGVAIVLMAVFCILRMTSFNETPVYRDNVMMNANLVFLGFCLLMFLLFNLIFVRGFFKTAYKINKIYLLFVGAAIILLFFAEFLHFMPFFQILNSDLNAAADSSAAVAQILFLVICLVLYLAGTWFSFRSAKKIFETLDL